jgi:hypothetical protein
MVESSIGGQVGLWNLKDFGVFVGIDSWVVDNVFW